MVGRQAVRKAPGYVGWGRLVMGACLSVVMMGRKHYNAKRRGYMGWRRFFVPSCNSLVIALPNLARLVDHMDHP
jgi:hypothetical protein